MRTVDFFFIVFGTSLTSVYVHSKPTHSYSTLLLPNDVMRVKKRHEDSSTGYLEQCGIVKFPKAQQGVVNVLAFLDSSWPYSHRQAIMLKMLNERLRRSGLPDTLFFVVNVDPSYARTVDNAEDDIEREAWLGVSPDEIETFASIVKTTDSLAMSMTPDIQLIQDNQDLQIWKELRGSRDQVLVIDRCGKLTYQVIVPWSILHFPYVKAAILSTYKDEPCGPCDAIHSTRDPIKPNDDVTILDAKMESISTTEEYFQNDREGHAPTKSDSIENGSVLESSTIDSIQLGSPHNYLMSKGIDVAEETTTSSNIFNVTENYTGMNSDTENEAELTTLTSTTYITAADLTKIEIDSTTPIKTDTTDSTNTMTENFNSQTPVFEVNEKSVQNTDQPESVTISTSLINTDSTYSVSYYDTTANIYTKGNEDTTTQKTLESDSTKLFSIDEKSATLQNEEIQSLVEKYDTTTKKIVSSNTESVIPVEEKSNKRKNSENLEDRLDENSEEIQSAVEKYDSTTFINSYVDNVADLAASTNFMADTTTKKIVSSNTESVIRVEEKSNKSKNSENLEDRLEENNEDIQSSVEKYDSTTFINSNVDNVADLAASTNFMADTTTKKIVSSNTESVIRVEDKSNKSKNSENLEDRLDENREEIQSSVEKYDSTTFINSDVDDVADLAASTNFIADTTTKKIVSLNTESVIRVEEKSNKSKNSENLEDRLEENSEEIQSSVEKYDSTTFINSNVDNVADLAASTNFMADTTTKKIVSSNTESVEEKSNKSKNSENLEDKLDENSETENTSQLSDMPLRIIMHAPHFHIDGDSTRMHEYLVLKTGSSDYHRHLASYDATRLYRGPQDFQETLEYIRNPEIESKKWPMTNVIYNRDESPGLYGEVADYWKNSGGQDNYDYTEETENSGVEEYTEEPNADDEISKKPAKADDTNFSESVGILTGESTISNGVTEKTAGITESWQTDFENESITENQALNDEVTNVEEEETRSKLIAHYSKLLPWIYYVLDK